jgi:hypothetical protein
VLFTFALKNRTLVTRCCTGDGLHVHGNILSNGVIVIRRRYTCACFCSCAHFVLSSHLSPPRSVHHKPQCRCWLFRHRFPPLGCASFVANLFSAFLAFYVLIRIGRFSFLQSSRPSLQLHALFNQRVSRLYEPTFLISALRLGMFQLRLNLWSSCYLSLFGRYFVLTAVWLVIATFSLVIIHRSSAHIQSSDSTISMRTDSISNDSAHTLEASLIPESKHAVFSFTTRCFDQMHQYSVVFIILSSGFWQYFVQGLMSQLALGPILSSQYQINLFWIQQCHLTIGASYSSRSTHFLMPPQVLFSAVACAI